MDTKLLIDAIVQQTTVLIAQLSTAAGIRAPLARLADQVFLDRIVRARLRRGSRLRSLIVGSDQSRSMNFRIET